MTTTIRRTTPNMTNTTETHARPWLLTIPALAGIAYTLVWLIGLAVWPANLDINAASQVIVATYRASQAQAMAQIGLVEGVAALALGAVALAVGRFAARRGVTGPGRGVATLGVIAATISLVQTALGEALAAWVAPSGDASLAATLFDLLNRLDGVKMFTLAAMAVTGIWLARGGALPRWLGYGAAPLAALALVISGIGYLLLNSPLALAAAVSLPLLLIWVTGAGIAVALAGRKRSRPAAV